jgi:type II secretory pathway component GspD/PulD (secretin)
MSRTLKGWAVGGVALAAAVASFSVRAEPQPPAAEASAAQAGQSNASSDARSRRRIVPVQNGSAKDLAAVLQKHFQGEAEIQAAPDSSNNSLLVAAVPAVFDEVVETLAQLDRPSKKLVVDVLLVDVLSPREAGIGKPGGEKAVDERDFTGPIEKVLARLETLASQKKIVNVRQMRIETLENQSGMFQAGEQKPVINGFTTSAVTGVASPTVQQRPAGSVVTVTPRVVGAGKVVLELLVRNDRIESPEDGVELAKGANGPLIAPEVVTVSLQSRITVSAGQTAVVGGMQNNALLKQTQTHIIVAARIAEESPPSETK